MWHTVLTDDDAHEKHDIYGWYLDEMNCGKLTIPTDSVVHLVYRTYVIFCCPMSQRAACHQFVIKCFTAVAASYCSLESDVSTGMCQTLCNIYVNNLTAIYADWSKESMTKIAKLS